MRLAASRSLLPGAMRRLSELDGIEPAALPAAPLLKPWYRIARDGERVVLEYADSTLVLGGGAARQLVPALLPLLDGRHTIDELVSELGPAAAPAVELVLAELQARGALSDGPALSGEEPRDDTAVVLAALERDASPRGVRDALATQRALVAGDGAHAGELARVLTRSGLESVRRVSLATAGTLAGSGVLVAAPSTNELELLDGVNERALREGTPWLEVLPFDGRQAAVGPLYVPEETCCRRCYLLRRAAASGYPDEFWSLSSSTADRRMPPFLSSIVAGLAALVALRWLLRRDPTVTGTLFALELTPAMSLTAHAVYRVPRCPACSSSSADPLPWYEASPA